MQYIQIHTNTYKSGIMYFQNALVTVYLIPYVMKIRFTVKIIPFESGKCKINLNTVSFSLLFPEETI